MPEKDKDKSPKNVSETDTLIKKAKLVKEAPTGEGWEKVTSGGKEVYVKRTKRETPPSETPVVPPKPDKTQDKVKYKGPPPSNKPKPKPKPKDTPKEEDFTEEVVTLEEKKPKSQQTSVFGDVQTYENIDPAKQWGANYGITTIETPDAEGRYTNTSRKYNIDKEGREIVYDLANPLNSFKDGKFTPTYTGRTIDDIRKEYTTQQIETPRMSGVYKRTDPNYQGSLMMPGTKATRISGGGAGEFNQMNVGKIPGALSTAPVGYIEQKYDTQGKPIATPNQGVQFDEKNLTPLRKGEMEVGKMYDIPSKEPVEIKGNFAKGGKVMAPKMMYADGTPPDGVNSEEEKAKIKAEEEAVKAKADAIEKGKKDYESRYNAAKKIVAAQNDRKGKISSYDKRLKEAEAKLNALEKSYKDYSAEKEIIKGQKQPETVWGMKTEANPEKIREDKKKMLADLESARKEYNSVKQVYDFVKDDKNYDANTGEMKSKTAPKVTAKVNPPVTTAPPTDAATTGSTTTRGVVKGGSSKVKPGKLTAEVMQPKNIALSTLEQEREAGIEKQMNEGEKSVLGTTERVKAQSEAENKARQDADAAALAKNPSTQSKLAQALSGVNTEALIGAGQAALGYNMLKGEKRPGYKFELDPAYQASVERQKQDASYGFTAEKMAMENQNIANAKADSRFIARSGPNAGAAYNQETQAINQAWMNQLALTSKDQELKMAKQQISDQSIKERAGIMTGAKRQAYEDAMGRFQQIQQAGSELVGAGIRNVIGSTRLNKELEAMKAAKAQQDAYLGTVGTA